LDFVIWNLLFAVDKGGCMMKGISQLVILIAAPLLTAAIWMDDQQTYKPYKGPVLSPPVDSVPVSGKEIISHQAELKNPVPSTGASLSQGKKLFDINCAMCHGQTSEERGLVGKRLVPPPPGLDHDMVKGLSDSTIFKAITFGFGRMPQFRDKLGPDERWSLINFLRTRK
jgi:mono/diheme cytochrome c family protein